MRPLSAPKINYTKPSSWEAVLNNFKPEAVRIWQMQDNSFLISQVYCSFDYLLMSDKLCLQLWVFHLLIVSRNFTPNIAMAIL